MCLNLARDDESPRGGHCRCLATGRRAHVEHALAGSRTDQRRDPLAGEVLGISVFAHRDAGRLVHPHQGCKCIRLAEFLGQPLEHPVRVGQFRGRSGPVRHRVGRHLAEHSVDEPTHGLRRKFHGLAHCRMRSDARVHQLVRAEPEDRPDLWVRVLHNEAVHAHVAGATHPGAPVDELGHEPAVPVVQRGLAEHRREQQIGVGPLVLDPAQCPIRNLSGRFSDQATHPLSVSRRVPTTLRPSLPCPPVGPSRAGALARRRT
ncbi:unannotated protein [freshwater metagenome]|uniref:Unannotated protein n=1 Tax=freshwater metagenome TaxID=449393 RepID=A0A6J6S9K2_9ZZZZ